MFEAILTREKMGSTGIGVVSPSRTGNWKKIPYAPSACSLFSSKTPSRSAPSITSRSISSSPCWCPPIKLKTHLHTLSLAGETSQRIKRSCRRLRPRRAEELASNHYLTPKVSRMRAWHNSMAFLFCRCEEKRCMVLMIVSGRSGSR